MWSYHHATFTVHQLPAIKDNYIYLIEANNSQQLIAVDPGEAVVVNQYCRKQNQPLTHILNTHHHWDHTDGNTALKKRHACKIIGYGADRERIPGLDIEVDASHPPHIPGLNIKIIELPGHTTGHIAYLIDDALFCGDTLFGGGCGRIFEGTHAQMWHSLCTLAALPPQTRVYCAHEYTLSNLAFAQAINPENQSLVSRMATDQARRQQDLPTIPSTIESEIMTNPFLWPLDSSFRHTYANRFATENDALSVFTDLRQKKDHL